MTSLSSSGYGLVMSPVKRHESPWGAHKMRSESSFSWSVQQNSMIPHPVESVTIGLKSPMHEPESRPNKNVLKIILLNNCNVIPQYNTHKNIYRPKYNKNLTS